MGRTGAYARSALGRVTHHGPLFCTHAAARTRVAAYFLLNRLLLLMPLTASDLHTWIRAFADRIAEERAYLTKLDSAIGDGDHGQNMNRGLSHAVSQIDDNASMSDTMRTLAMALISKTGGASGPLYGTFFMDAGKTTAHHDTLGTPEVATLFRAGLSGVQRRGKAKPNDKTMVDALLARRRVSRRRRCEQHATAQSHSASRRSC